MTFQFDLGQRVKLTDSEEQGSVVGRAEYQQSSPSYFVRYRTADGCLTETWWSGSALVAIGSAIIIQHPDPAV